MYPLQEGDWSHFHQLNEQSRSSHQVILPLADYQLWGVSSPETCSSGDIKEVRDPPQVC